MTINIKNGNNYNNSQKILNNAFHLNINYNVILKLYI